MLLATWQTEINEHAPPRSGSGRSARLAAEAANRPPGVVEANAMPELRTVDGLVVDVALDNQTDSYSSKPAHVSPEFNNVVAAGARELSGTTLCCAQLGLALVLTVTVDGGYLTI